MPRRKQLKGIAGNIVQFCLSRNFDDQGYWAVGQLYAYAQENNSNEFVINLVNEYTPNEVVTERLSRVNYVLSRLLKRELETLKIPNWWIKDVEVIFTFETEYQKKYHSHTSSLVENLPCVRSKSLVTLTKHISKNTAITFGFTTLKKSIVAMGSNNAKHTDSP